IMVPGGTPQSVIDTLSTAFKAMAGEPTFRNLIEQQGMDATYYGPAEAAGFWNGEIDKWESVVKAAGSVGQGARCAPPTPRSVTPKPRNFQRREMVVQNPRQLLRRRAAKAAIGGKPKIRQEFARDIKPLPQRRHRVDRPEIDAGAFHIEPRKRRIE